MQAKFQSFNWKEPIKITAIVTILALIIFVAYTKKASVSSTPRTIDERVKEINTLREEKKKHEEAIYKINERIIPLKCSVYKDVQAKEQWEYDCRQYFETQQSKIKEQAQSLPEDTGGYTPEEQ